MAKYTPGPMVAAVSGSVGGTVFSRNRYGAYTRFRAIPVNPINDYTSAAKNYMAAASANWKTLSEEIRAAWATWAASNPVVDALGQSQILQGNSAYVMLATRLLNMGEALPTTPPATPAPLALATLAGSFDIGAGDFELTFTTAPLAANQRLWAYAAVTNSPAIKYVQNLRKLVYIGAAATASPADIQSAIEERFGTLQVGQYVTIDAAVADDETGLISPFLRVSGPVEDTV